VFPASLIPLTPTPRRVDVRAIDRELADLWREAAERSGSERVALSRARTLNLVAVAATPEEGLHLAEVAARISERHPARAIILMADPHAEELVAEVTAICRVGPRDHRQICCEQVLLHTSSGAVHRLPSLVRQTVLPEMPVVLYWPGPPTGDRLFRELLEVADRVIVDTAAVPDGHGALLAAHTLVAGAAVHATLGDLAWRRMAAWRGLTAELFAPPAAEALDRIKRIRLAHAASSRAQGLLYLGWLAGRLRWRVEQPCIRGEGPWRGGFVDRHGGSISVSLHADSRAPHPAGALLSALVVAGSPAAHGGGSLAITRNDEAGALIAVAEWAGGERVRRALPLDEQDEPSLLASEMDVLGRDPVYEESLRAAASLLGRG